MTKIKVTIDGLQPLTMDTILEFSKNEESLVSQDYEKLEKHCVLCKRLTHEVRDCPERKGKEKEVSQRVSPPPPPPRGHSPPEDQNRRFRSESRDFSRRTDRYGKEFGDRPSSKNLQQHKQSSATHLSTHLNKSHQRYYREKSPTPSYQPRTWDNRNSPLRSQGGDLRNHLNSKDWLPKNRAPDLLWRQKGLVNDQTKSNSTSPKSRRPPLERDLYKDSFGYQPIIQTHEEVMEELREVTVRYIHCPEQGESAARRGRVNEGEERGMMAETAAHIVAAQAATLQQALTDSAIQDNRDLSPDLPHLVTDCGKEGPLQKKKRGRPPLKKKGLNSPLPGASTKLRNFRQVQSSPRNKQTKNTIPHHEKNHTRNNAASSSHQVASTATTGEQPVQLPTRYVMIPAITKKDKGNVDFQNPQNAIP